MNTKTACKLARALDAVSEKDHFGSDAFYAHKRIFATVWHDHNEVNLRLTPELQDHYVGLDGDGFSRIDNGWGRMGWTTAHLDYLENDAFVEALRAAWELTKQPRKKSPAKKGKATKAKTAKKARKRSGSK